jgi:hypothetical protein
MVPENSSPLREMNVAIPYQGRHGDSQYETHNLPAIYAQKR